MKFLIIVFAFILVIISCDNKVEPNHELKCDTSNVVKTDVTGQVLISRGLDHWKLDIKPTNLNINLYTKIKAVFPNPTSTRTNSTLYFELLKDAKVKILLDESKYILNENLAKGIHQIEINTSVLNEGCHKLNFECNIIDSNNFNNPITLKSWGVIYVFKHPDDK